MSSLGLVNPKKRRDIDGVSGSSMVDLKATLFKAEEDAKRAKAMGTAVPKSKLVVKQVPSHNKGVEERNRRDHEALQSRSDPTVSLRDKTGQYDAMTMVGYRDEKEAFLVDFEQKRWQHDAEQEARQGAEPGAPALGSENADQDCPEAVVRRHLGDGHGAGAVLLQLGDEMRTEAERAKELKEKRLAAAKKRMAAAKKH